MTKAIVSNLLPTQNEGTSDQGTLSYPFLHVLLPCKSQQFILKTDDIEGKGMIGKLFSFQSFPTHQWLRVECVGGKYTFKQ